MITNTVLLALKRAEDIPLVRDKLLSMRGQIGCLLGIEVYENQRETGYHLMQVGRYTDMDALRAYLDHPVHLAVSGFVSPRIEKIASFCSENA